MDNFREEIVSRVRSCLISTKGQISLKQLEDDYRTLLGERIPYGKLGFSSLSGFIQSVPSLVLTKTPDGRFLVDAKPSEMSSHISSMVSKQKAPPKKKVAFRPDVANKQYPPVMTKWRPKNFSGPKKYYQSSPKLAAVSHSQFISKNADGGGHRRLKKLEIKISDSKAAVVDGPQDNEPCSPLASTKRRISKLMAKIDLDRDSGNSSPTYDEFPAPVKGADKFVRTGDPVSDLKHFAVLHKLGEVEVKFTETRPKSSKTTLHHCKIKVGQHSYSSYPNDFFDGPSAEKFTAQKALDDLVPKHDKRRSLLISSNDDIIERIPPMLEKHPNAVWMAQIELDYIDRYGEQLPTNWLQIVDVSPSVSIEKCLGGYVLKYCKPGDVLQKGKKLGVNLNVFDVSVPCNTVHFGENNRLYAIVTVATSVSDIWCQQCGTPEYDSFVEMSTNMDAYYNKKKENMVAKNITVHSCYVAYTESGWARVRVISTPKEGYVNCFMFDYGEECYVPTKNVYYLRREFAVHQAQAFVCCLKGLEELYTVSLGSDHLQSLLGKEVALEMVPDEAYSPTAENEEIAIPVVIYDVADGRSINEELISLLTIESATPALDKNIITEVHVSNIEENGDVYVQVRTRGFYALQETLEQLEASIEKDPPAALLFPVTRDNSQGRLYLVKYKTIGRWLRASILDWSPRGDMAQIYFIDHGNTDVINVRKETIYPLDKLDDVVNQFPAQAVKVRIMIDAIPENFVESASKLMPRDHVILLKIIHYDNENVARVEFFKRSSDGELFCINRSITMEAELQNIDNANNNDKRKRLRNLRQQYNETNIKNVPSGGSLKKPALPEKGQYFNVNVPFAVNPWNFFVQPLDTLDKLTAMMEAMQLRYRDVEFSPLPIDDIIPGNIYASRHEDGRWYRTSVLKVIHSGSISVFYCDFGYYTNLSLYQLVPLDLAFMDLPYQALKAKLSGIKPTKNKWSVDDCETFKNLVTKKQFVSVLVEIEKDELYRSDIILDLLLIDTATDKDVHIRDELVRRGIAISA